MICNIFPYYFYVTAGFNLIFTNKYGCPYFVIKSLIHGIAQQLQAYVICIELRNILNTVSN